jgi:hypothetical protein
MADDYMSDSGPTEGGNPTPPPEEGEEQAESKTALLPISFFEGKELTPGTECKVRVEGVQEDQVEVSYVPHTEEVAPEGSEAELPPEDFMA